MEKKTIGKFISVLRRANGMTQKELGDKLYVSDKTVSRWERDECLPELSLIPAIAEIFGVTTDELLRGERNSIEKNSMTPTESKRVRGEKQFKAMLHQNEKKFSNLSFISIGLTLAGIIVAALCNGFYKSILGGLLGILFFIAAAICEICFTNAFSIADYEDEHEEEVKATNTRHIEFSVNVIFFILAATFFTLPLIFLGGWHYGINFSDTWLPVGLIMTAVGLIISFAIYKLAILPTLIKNGAMHYEEKEKNLLKENQKLLKKSLKILAVVLVSVIVLGIINSLIDDNLGYTRKHVFETKEEVKEFLENQYDEWLYEAYDKTVKKYEDGFPIGEKKTWYSNSLYSSYQSDQYPMMILEYDKNGKFQYYHNPDLNYIENIHDVSGEEVYRIITDEDYYNGEAVRDTINVILVTAAFLSTLGCASYYIYKSKKAKS